MRNVVKSFINELNNGIPQKTADSNLLKVYKLQKNRLDEEGIEMRMKVTPSDDDSEWFNTASWKDDHYKTDVICAYTTYNRSFYKKGENTPIYNNTGRYLFYSDVTECRDYSVAQDDPYECPNCGSVSTLQKISSEGCSHCGAHFSMSELYPKVSCNYMVNNLGTKKQLVFDILKFVVPSMIICMILGMINFGRSRLPVINGLFGGLFSGAFLGYILWVGSVMWKLFSGVAKAVPKISSAKDSRKEFTSRMREISEEFSYEYFTAEAISKLKAIMYSSKDSSLSFYTGNETVEFDHIVESSFSGALGLKAFRFDGNVVTTEVLAFMENFYYIDGRIVKKDETIQMTLMRDISQKMDYHFNIRSVNCPSCASSFDAYSNPICPYCGTHVNMSKHDWIVTSCKKQ